MTKRSWWARLPRGVFAIVVGLPMVHSLAACARSEYAGISLRPGTVPAALQTLAEQAKAGDKMAQYRLGERFETGNGVPFDLERAKSLFRSAANASGGPVTVYVPATGNGSSGQLMTIDTAEKLPGVVAAKLKLLALERFGK